MGWKRQLTFWKKPEAKEGKKTGFQESRLITPRNRGVTRTPPGTTHKEDSMLFVTSATLAVDRSKQRFRQSEPKAADIEGNEFY
jgi:hypothetical protein